MSLQSETAIWRDDYDNSGITGGGGDAAYLGSIQGPTGYHTGPGIYNPNPGAGLVYEIFDFNWYAGQGLTGTYGAKYLLNSEGGFSWDTKAAAVSGKFDFVTTGDLDNLYLGYNPFTDTGASPAELTLTTFRAVDPLLVVENFDIAANYVALNTFGVANGNVAIDASDFVSKGLLSNAQYYDKVTLNSAVIYDLSFDIKDASVFEFVLDRYLESRGSDITDSFLNIQTALAGTGVSITYYDAAGDYASGGVITALAQPELEVASDLLLAA
ncbi:hypothetical protein [Pollutimonas bauzanensis]|uniref:Heme acquisition protein HasA n=1 Tax=Pollutimonas bauzanensis TaxID=658167 RepID=A0A1M5ZN31_9BURK|nr:hypothetical protein [Pollutimonas bauzanensis]SHI25591.1 hypothetical protein SAMN04488135_11660 [Pollutimonas bauzanensis]